MKSRGFFWLFPILTLVFVQTGCRKELDPSGYQTENVLIIVFDGARYTETWGESTHRYIPSLASSLAPEGVILTNFYNKGYRVTIPGHAAILTGNYEDLQNNGNEVPAGPSILQEWLFQSGQKASSAWIISSKGKLDALKSCKSLEWLARKKPFTNCGVNGQGLHSAHREDRETLDLAKTIIPAYRARIALISLKEPDVSGHAGDWNSYLAAIHQSDSCIQELWDFIQTDPFYKGKTSIFITNDHGRHSEGIANGFVGHGDDCEGCSHLFFFAAGPDFKKNVILDHPYELIDIGQTAAKLLGITLKDSKGSVMTELFQ